MIFFGKKEFFWDLNLEKKIKDLDLEQEKNKKNVDYDISYICLCKIEENDKMIIQAFSPDSKLDRDSALKMLDKLKNEYKKINNFIVQYSNNKIDNFYRDKNDLIKIVDQTAKKQKNNNSSSIIPSKQQIELNDKKTEEIKKSNQPSNKGDVQDINKLKDFFNKLFKFNKKEFENVPFVKTSMSEMTEEESNYFIENNLEDIEDWLIDDEVNLDKQIKNMFSKIFNRQGMGKFYAIQSIISSGKLMPSEGMFNEIISKLEELYKRNKGKKKKGAEEFGNLITEEKEDNYLATMCVVYARFLNKWKQGSGDNNIKGSAPYRNAMTSYFPEIISPFIFLYNNRKLNGNDNCLDEKSKESIRLLQEKVGKSNLLEANPYISYPQSATQMLFDSVLYFGDNKENAKKFKCLRISVKGGKSGLGAKASISGLKSYFYEKGNANLPDNLFTSRRFFDASLYSDYYRPYIKKFASESQENQIVLKILSALMLSNKSGYKMIIKTACEYLGIKYKTELKMYEKFQRYMNENKVFEKCVLIALQYASYDFAQLNCRETPSGDGDFHYNYSIQYPALFKGHIDFELLNGDKLHKLTFHIIGE